MDPKRHEEYCAQLEGMKEARYPYWVIWRELADYYLPTRYSWLLSSSELAKKTARNPYILDGTGTSSARTLAAGMMNGITSPSRPWVKLRINNFSDDANEAVKMWLEEATRRMLMIMAESNFYNALATMYLDLAIFGSAAMLIYEDRDSVIRCYTPALGEFYFAESSRGEVNQFAREFYLTPLQLREQFGEENLSEPTKQLLKSGGKGLHTKIKIAHLIVPNPGKSKGFAFSEYYWESGAPHGKLLSEKGFKELPGIFVRWEVNGNDAYGTCPGMDALGDVIQLQHETKKKAQGLDKLMDPPVVADIQLQNRPTALQPRGVTYVAGTQNVGIRPAYQVQVPLQEMTMDIREVQTRIREIFHNDLFRMISQLETVRSATEIDARREEKLVLLGSVLERFDNEALDPAINRIFNIMARAGLLPEAPPELANVDIEIEYVSILSAAQRAVGVIPTERFLGLVGNLAAIRPEVMDIPNFDLLLRDYARDIGVSARGINPVAETMQLRQSRQEQLAAQEMAVQGDVAVNAAKTLSETQVTPGVNALQAIIGG